MNVLPRLIADDPKFRVLLEQMEALLRDGTPSGRLGHAAICEVCGEAESTIYCPSDRAHFCEDCDTRHHASSKLLMRHNRVSVHHSPLQFGRCTVHHSEFVEFVDLAEFRLLCRVCLETSTAGTRGGQVVSTLDALKVSQAEDSVWQDVARKLKEAVHRRHRKLLEIKNQLESVTARIKNTHQECTKRIHMHSSNNHDILTSMKKQILLKLLTVELVETWRVHYRLSANVDTFLVNDHVFRNNRSFLLLASDLKESHRPAWLNAKIDIQGTLVVADRAITAPISLVPRADAPLLLEPLPSAGDREVISKDNELVAAKPKSEKHRLPLRQAADFSDSISRAEAAVAEVDTLMTGKPRAEQMGRVANNTYENSDLVDVLKAGVFPFENALEILKNAKQSDRQMLIREMLQIFPIGERRKFMASLIDHAVQTVQTPLLLNSAPSLVVTVVTVLAEDGRVSSLIERAALTIAGRKVGDSETEALLATRRLIDGLLQQRTADLTETETFRFFRILLNACQERFGAFSVGLNVCTGLFISRVLTPIFVKRCNGTASISKVLLRVSRGEESGDDDLRELFALVREWMHGALDRVIDGANFGVENVKSTGLGKMLQEYIQKYRMINS
jgi:hypothetical protein